MSKMSKWISTRERNIRLQVEQEQKEKEKNRLEHLTSLPHESLTLAEASEVVYLLTKELEVLDKKILQKKERAQKIISYYYEVAPEIEQLKKMFEQK